MKNKIASYRGNLKVEGSISDLFMVHFRQRHGLDSFLNSQNFSHREEPSKDQVDISFNNSSFSDVENDSIKSIAVDGSVTELTPEELQLRLAKSYQEYMKLILTPVVHGTGIPYISWMELGKSVEQICGQPLHYLTHLHLKQLRMRMFPWI